MIVVLEAMRSLLGGIKDERVVEHEVLFFVLQGRGGDGSHGRRGASGVFDAGRELVVGVEIIDVWDLIWRGEEVGERIIVHGWDVGGSMKFVRVVNVDGVRRPGMGAVESVCWHDCGGCEVRRGCDVWMCSGWGAGNLEI